MTESYHRDPDVTQPGSKVSFQRQCERDTPELCHYDEQGNFLGTHDKRYDGRARHRAIADALFDMRYSHLKGPLANVSRPFCILAFKAANDGPENSRMTLALTKLCEAKDCAVRAHVRASFDNEVVPAK